MTIGLALIAKDEAKTLPTLLACIPRAFDHIVLVDTGSTDRTVNVFKNWCRKNHQRHTIDRFDWVDDFAAARNYADSLLETDWICYADADDIIGGIENLSPLLERAAGTDGLAVVYGYLSEDGGTLKLPHNVVRVARNGVSHWEGRVHEKRLVLGDVVHVPPQLMFWADTRGGDHWHIRQSTKRNASIFEDWMAEAPDDPVLLSILRTRKEAGLR